MKKILILIALLATITIQAQTDIEIYGYTNGIRNISPDKVLKQNGNTTEVYNVENGIESFTPEKVIINNKIYNVTNGIRDFTPEAIIEEEQ